MSELECDCTCLHEGCEEETRPIRMIRNDGIKYWYFTCCGTTVNDEPEKGFPVYESDNTRIYNLEQALDELKELEAENSDYEKMVSYRDEKIINLKRELESADKIIKSIEELGFNYGVIYIQIKEHKKKYIGEDK